MAADLSASEARRIALAAQGLTTIRSYDAVGAARVRAAIGRLGVLQIDSVNVLARAHYLPLYARLGPYDRALLDAAMPAKSKRFFEYWGHEASLLPIELHPLFRWRMARARRGVGMWSRCAPFANERKGEAKAMLARIRDGGPVAASDVAGARADRGMWVWSDAKLALEFLFWSGQVAATHRRGSFERVYDLPERVLPAEILALPTPTGDDARRELIERSARALGVATATDLRDYYRIPAADAPRAIADLVEAGTLVPVRVEGWPHRAYLHRDATPGGRPRGATLLSPFDPLIWHRPRTERLFGFRYRLEIYTPAHLREHGYYVLPFLLDGALVARVDLKADRQRSSLVVLRAHLEPAAPTETIERLRDELRRLATWLGLASIAIVEPDARFATLRG